MKTETQIAEENVKELRKLSDKVDWMFCQVHLETCQRFLERLENTNPKKFPSHTLLEKLIDRMITDLKQAIKIYEDGGVK